MARERWPRVSRALEWLLVAIGVACMAQYAWLSRRIDRIETENREAVERMLSDQPSALIPVPSALSPVPSQTSTLLGALDIPRLRLSAAVRYGDDNESLDGSVGYLSDTALPWTPGNTVLAAHRDRLFRSLEGIRAGDQIFVTTRHGTIEYSVNRTFVVSPKDVWILDPVPNVDLTLITCYPFVFTGHAPQRFVVRAHKISGSAEASPERLRVVRPGPDVEREDHEDDP